ncbi:MAG TPA: ATP phosphoribosyltransferase regulatory subunit [Candidatus Saccharimonadales bacterium]|nr:ATP phosphoribosyltransferase regulatory subunit [Candidatus Saccharimonadales bacterium]
MTGLDALPPGASVRGRADGFADYLVGPAGRRRLLIDRFIETFEAWGYGFMVTPLIEPLDTIAAGVGGARQSALFRFMDSDGALLALVGERTVSVARVVATQLQEGPFPLRLCYAGSVLRNQAINAGRRRESLQAGCELVGAGGLAADAECIALAASALERGGVEHIQVDVGHADFIPGLLDSAGLDATAREEVLGALARRDLVAVESALEGTDAADVERRLLLAFPTLRGGREILETAAGGLRGDRSQRALQELAQLWDLLDAHAITDRVHLDLGAVRDWDYYTGPTFEVFSVDSGFALGSGGRYDTLLSRFGAPLSATGFVLHVDRCHDSIVRRAGAPPAPVVLQVSWEREAHAGALELARGLRHRGVACACDLVSGGEGDVQVGTSGVRWSHAGHDGRGTIDAAVAALASRAP